VKHIWLYLNRTDIETERRQCHEEGRDLSSVEEEFQRVLALDLEDLRNQPAAESLLDRTIGLPLRPGCTLHEPSDLEGIRAARPADSPALPPLSLTDASLEDKVHGAWLGRCAGCLLGKPVEGWRRPRMWGLLRESGRWPLSDYFRLDSVSPELRRKYEMAETAPFADRVEGMPEDDDTNYTATGLAILQRFGPGFTPEDVAAFWLGNIPILHTCTAERVAYRNLVRLIPPPASASFRNPYREWIGAQIRADFWGYAAPGNPELAAEMAWRDACVSHVKNGIYGEMWAAAVISAAFVTDHVPTILRAGLAQIPARCRLADEVERFMDLWDGGADYDTALRNLHDLWNEESAHDWCHVISNAVVVTIGLLYGEGDFQQTICRAVQACFDTDCNGATTGSILGILHGRRALPPAWTGVLNDTLQTGVAGWHSVRISNLARETLAAIERVAAGGAGA